jgi:hypothetical protein
VAWIRSCAAPQRVEPLNGIQEVGGSTPGSTKIHVLYQLVVKDICRQPRSVLAEVSPGYHQKWANAGCGKLTGREAN